jgi:3-oxoacyl-[acyl-carrier-protein] synthase III
MTHQELEGHLQTMRRIIGAELAMRRRVFAKDEKKLFEKVSEISELNQAIKAVVDALKATMPPPEDTAALIACLPTQPVLLPPESPFTKGY